MKHTAKATMQLSGEQNRLFVESAERHRTSIERLEQKQADLLKNYFLPIADSSDNSNQDSILNKIELIEKEKLELTRLHFIEVRSLLKPGQYKGFEKFLRNAVDRIFKKDKRIPPPRRNE